MTTHTSHRRIRVLMVTGAYYPEITGGARQCQTLIEALRDRIDFTVLSVSNTSGLESPDQVDGVPVYRLQVNPQRPWEKAGAAVRLAMRLFALRRRVDVVHLHGFTQKSILLVLLARLMKKPLLLKLGGLGQDDPDVVGARGGLFRRAYASVDRFVAPSPALARALQQAGVSSERTNWIPNGVNLTRFRPADAVERAVLRRELGLAIDAVVVLCVGMMAEVKRPQLLFDAWSHLPLAANLRSMLVFCTTRSAFAEIDPGIAAGITAAAAAMGAAERVQIVPQVFDIERYYRAADLFVLPSASEGLPNALMEAMASGLACIASRLPGITDALITDGVDGRLVPSGDVAAFSDALRDLIEHPDRAAALGRQARGAIERNFAIATTAARHADLYEAMLARPA